MRVKSPHHVFAALDVGVVISERWVTGLRVDINKSQESPPCLCCHRCPAGAPFASASACFPVPPIFVVMVEGRAGERVVQCAMG